MMVPAVYNRQSKIGVLVFLFLCACAVLILTPLIGANKLSLANVFSGAEDSMDYKIFWQMRIPRSLVAFMAGAVFALSGMVFQAIFRNPLVCSFTLGVSTGASFGATIYIWLGLPFVILGFSGISIFAFLGALLSIFIVWSLTKVKYGSSIAKMLLAGVVVSFFFMSLIMFIQYMSNLYESMRITRWLMGGLYVFGYKTVLDVLPFTVVGLGTVWYFAHELNLLTTGEELATSRGVDVPKTVKILFFLISVMIGGMVSVCGPISFIGIIAPHICRLMVGSDHRFLAPATFLFGGLFLTLCDTFARTVAAPAEIPVGIITALIGGPFFLWLLRQKLNE